MARHFAYRMQQMGGKETSAQIRKGYEAMMYKPITNNKLNTLIELYNKSLITFKKDKEAACEMIGIDDEHNNPETASLVVVANAMLNLDEWMNK